MPKTRSESGLQIEQDYEFQRREWKAERFGWAAIALILVAALIGLFGVGPISDITAGDRGSSFWAEQERFIRYQAPFELLLHVSSTVAQNQEVRIWFAEDYLRHFQVETFSPEPERVIAGGERVIYVFEVEDADRSIPITLRMRTSKIGLISGQAGIEGDQTLQLQHFVYP